MKKILLFLLILLSYNLEAQDSTRADTSKITLKQVYSDAKDGFKTVVTGIQSLAVKLEGPAKHVYYVYVYQYKAKGIASLIGYTLFFFIPVIIFFSVMLGKRELGDPDPNRYGWIVIFTGVISLVSLICLIFSISTVYTQITNPEYYAIQDIINAFK